MRPKRKRDIIQEIAPEFNHPELEQAIDFYWGEISQLVRSVGHIRIHVHELGDLCFAKTKIDKMIANYQAALDALPADSTRRVVLEERLVQLHKAAELRDQDYQKKADSLARRKTYEQTKENSSQPPQDSGGTVV
jgi:hypothetical protein